MTGKTVSDTMTLQKGNKVKILNWTAAVKSENLYHLVSRGNRLQVVKVSLCCGEIAQGIFYERIFTTG